MGSGPILLTSFNLNYSVTPNTATWRVRASAPEFRGWGVRHKLSVYSNHQNACHCLFTQADLASITPYLTIFSFLQESFHVRLRGRLFLSFLCPQHDNCLCRMIHTPTDGGLGKSIPSFLKRCKGHCHFHLGMLLFEADMNGFRKVATYEIRTLPCTVSLCLSTPTMVSGSLGNN